MPSPLDQPLPYRASRLKLRYVLVVLFLAWGMLSVGGLFKIQSWPYASELLTLSTLLEVIGYGLGV